MSVFIYRYIQHTGYCVDQLLTVDNDLYKMQSYRRCFNSQGKKNINSTCNANLFCPQGGSP